MEDKELKYDSLSLLKKLGIMLAGAAGVMMFLCLVVFISLINSF